MKQKLAFNDASFSFDNFQSVCGLQNKHNKYSMIQNQKISTSDGHFQVKCFHSKLEHPVAIENQ